MPWDACATGTPSSLSIYLRNSDPWVSFGPDGTAYASGLAFNLGYPNWANSVAVATSRDFGASWQNVQPIPGSAFTQFAQSTDKNSTTADPRTPGTAYTVWDTLIEPTDNPDDNPHTAAYTGPAYFSKTTDYGATWSQASLTSGVVTLTFNSTSTAVAQTVPISLFGVSVSSPLSRAASLQVQAPVSRHRGHHRGGSTQRRPVQLHRLDRVAEHPVPGHAQQRPARVRQVHQRRQHLDGAAGHRPVQQPWRQGSQHGGTPTSRRRARRGRHRPRERKPLRRMGELDQLPEAAEAEQRGMG